MVVKSELVNYILFDNKPEMNQNNEDFETKTSKIISGYLCEFKDELIIIANELNIPYIPEENPHPASVCLDMADK